MTVRKLQDLLAYLDFYGGAMDGLWGPETQGALLRFQQRAALRADGIPGPETEAALKKAVCLGLPEEAPEGDWWKTVRHFTRQEFACKCGQYHSPYCDGYPAEPKEALVRIADALRSHFGVPVTVVSGLRCPRHNRDSGGVEGSYHLTGEAADIHAAGIPAETVEAWLDGREDVRYHYTIPGSENVHFDIYKGGGANE